MRAIPIAPTLVLAGLLAGSALARAEGGGSAASSPTVSAAPALAGAVAPPAASPSPGLDVARLSPHDEKASKPLVTRWWFWTALGAVVATAVVIMVLSDRGSSAPNTTLGNREFQP